MQIRRKLEVTKILHDPNRINYKLNLVIFEQSHPRQDHHARPGQPAPLRPPPDDHEDSAAGQTDFADIDGRRCFSSAFYTDLLAHLCAALFVSLDPLPPAAAAAQRAAYADAGLGYCALDDLCGGAGARMSLQSLDRLVSLVASSPWLVAVQGRGDGLACVHLAAAELRQHGRCAGVDAYGAAGPALGARRP